MLLALKNLDPQRLSPEDNVFSAEMIERCERSELIFLLRLTEA